MMGNGNDQHDLPANDEGKVEGESGQVYPPPVSLTESPQQGMLDDYRASVLHLVTKSSTQSRDLGLVVTSDALNLSRSFRMKLENYIHRSGTISRSLRKTSAAGTPFT